MRKFLIAVVLFGANFAFAADSAKATKSEDKKSAKTTETKGKDMFATMETSMGKIKIKLFPDKAPKTVDNFVSLAEGTKEWTDPKSGKKEKKPLYNGTVFHRVIKKFMIQGGDPLGTGTGGPGYNFEDEFSPDLRHSKAGILAMANPGKPNMNGSQFYITVEPTSWLDNKHTIFGEVVEGLDVVKKISETKAVSDRPVEDVVIKSVKIERK